MPTPIPESTLRAVYIRELPHRPHWPCDFEAAMQDATTRAVIELIARHDVPAFGRRRAERYKVGVLTGRRLQPELDVPRDEPIATRVDPAPHQTLAAKPTGKMAAAGDVEKLCPVCDAQSPIVGCPQFNCPYGR